MKQKMTAATGLVLAAIAMPLVNASGIYAASNSAIDNVPTNLIAQSRDVTRYESECRRCHDTAAAFVERSLELRAEALYGRKSGIEVQEFLNGHRRLSTKDAAFFADELRRVADEVLRR